MATGRGTKVLLAVAIASFAIGCENLLGTFEVEPLDGSAPEAGDVPDAAADQAQPGQEIEAGADAAATVVRPCEQPIDCPAVNMVPAACAIAQCIEKKCVYVAADKDGDGHPVGGCRVEGNLIPGDDCADNLPTVFPGGPCARRPDGGEIRFPTGAPVGACKAGVWDCKGGSPVCQGAVGPEPTENCALKNDANCDGVPDDGCDCTPNTVGDCGNAKGLPSPCTTGKRTCSADGKWGECIGNVEPSARDCSSTVDNDCNGQADQTEAACNCTGGVSQGKTAGCNSGQKGECAKGSWTCMPSADKQSGVFGPCVAPPAAAAPDCSSPLDKDCDGVGDELEVSCGSPCRLAGTKALEPAVQKFGNGMWGCHGVRTHAARGAACAPNNGISHRTCLAQEWLKFGPASRKTPSRKYWVEEVLGYGGSSSACYAASTTTRLVTACATGASMSVCPPKPPLVIIKGPAVTDADGNTCNWAECSYGTSYTDNDYFGGCSANDSAGTLCCQL